MYILKTASSNSNDTSLTFQSNGSICLSIGSRIELLTTVKQKINPDILVSPVLGNGINHSVDPNV